MTFQSFFVYSTDDRQLLLTSGYDEASVPTHGVDPFQQALFHHVPLRIWHAGSRLVPRGVLGASVLLW